MSFTFGGVRTAGLAGVTATLTEWPSLGGLSLESSDIPGRDGRSYAGSSRSHSVFVFDVIIEGSTPQETALRRDSFIGLLDPSRGPRALAVEIDTAWVWRDVMPSESVEWSRVGWDTGLGFTLRGEVTFETVGEPSAREATPQKVTQPGSGSFTLARGNTSAFPTIEFATGAAAVVTIGVFSLNVSATTGGTVVLDWENFDFHIRNSQGKRTASAVRHMSNYGRPVLSPGQAVTVSVKRGASFIACTLYPNARRI